MDHRDLLAGIGADDTSVRLIISRTLTKTDVSAAYARLSFPHKWHNRSMDFLSEEEESWIGTNLRKLPVKVVDPSGFVHEMNLSKWSFTPLRPQSWFYALTHGWIELATYNRLAPGDTIEVWSFRFVADHSLGFLLRKI